MKTNSTPSVALFEPAEDDVRDYAYHLYVQSGSSPGHDLDNWLEAKACLCACVPKSDSHARLHQHTEKQKLTKASGAAAKTIAA
jgi:hypothetical protein